jgi:CIC family chloride channel protein
MNNTTQIKKNYRFIKVQKLVVVSILIGFLSAFLGVILKNTTEYYEEIFFHQTVVNPIFLFIFCANIYSRKRKIKA